MEETQSFDWHLVRETEKARLFRDDEGKERWIPKSLIRSFTKYPTKNPGDPALCCIDVPEWWAEKEGLV